VAGFTVNRSPSAGACPKARSMVVSPLDPFVPLLTTTRGAALMGGQVVVFSITLTLKLHGEILANFRNSQASTSLLNIVESLCETFLWAPVSLRLHLNYGVSWGPRYVSSRMHGLPPFPDFGQRKTDSISGSVSLRYRPPPPGIDRWWGMAGTVTPSTLAWTANHRRNALDARGTRIGRAQE
jgi:hypothetical protein